MFEIIKKWSKFIKQLLRRVYKRILVFNYCIRRLLMNQRYRCDCCKKIFFENEMIKIIDSKGRLWYRCSNCKNKWGKKPRSFGYYASIQFEGVMGLEDPRKVVSYGPKKKNKNV